MASSVPLDERQTKNGPHARLSRKRRRPFFVPYRTNQTEAVSQRSPIIHQEAQLEIIDVISSTYYAGSGLSHPATLNRTGTVAVERWVERGWAFDRKRAHQQ